MKCSLLFKGLFFSFLLFGCNALEVNQVDQKLPTVQGSVISASSSDAPIKISKNPVDIAFDYDWKSGDVSVYIKNNSTDDVLFNSVDIYIYARTSDRASFTKPEEITDIQRSDLSEWDSIKPSQSTHLLRVLGGPESFFGYKIIINERVAPGGMRAYNVKKFNGCYNFVPYANITYQNTKIEYQDLKAYMLNCN